MPRYEYTCSDGHKIERVRPVAEAAWPGPQCQCGQATTRVFSVPRGNMFVTTQEAFEWADRVQAGTETFTADKVYEPERREI